MYAKHAESDSSEASDDSITNPPFRDKASKQMRDGSQRETEDLAWHNGRAWMHIHGTSGLLSLSYGWLNDKKRVKYFMEDEMHSSSLPVGVPPGSPNPDPISDQKM